jgi:hypothetical protein
MFKKYLIILIFILQACVNPQDTQVNSNEKIETIIQEYLLLELSMGIHHQDHVDAYFGPDHFKHLALETKLTLNQIHEKAEILSAQLKNLTHSSTMPIQRNRNLEARLRALKTIMKHKNYLVW